MVRQRENCGEQVAKGDSLNTTLEARGFPGPQGHLGATGPLLPDTPTPQCGAAALWDAVLGVLAPCWVT